MGLMGRLGAWFQLRRLMATPRSPRSPPHQSLLPSPHLSPPLPKNSSLLSSLLRFFSLNPAISGSYESGFVGGHQVYSHRSAVESGEEEDVVRYIPVKAYFLCTRYPFSIFSLFF